jgi:hypothetical protein
MTGDQCARGIRVLKQGYRSWFPGFRQPKTTSSIMIRVESQLMAGLCSNELLGVWTWWHSTQPKPTPTSAVASLATPYQQFPNARCSILLTNPSFDSLNVPPAKTCRVQPTLLSSACLLAWCRFKSLDEMPSKLDIGMLASCTVIHNTVV